MKKHSGSCHCKAVTYEVEADITEVMECNCSHCSRKGFLLAFVPEKQFTLLSGEDKLTHYQFNKKHLDHCFCKVCGVQGFSKGKNTEGEPMVGVNVRTLDDIDLETLTIQKFDGKSW